LKTEFRLKRTHDCLIHLWFIFLPLFSLPLNGQDITQDYFPIRNAAPSNDLIEAYAEKFNNWVNRSKLNSGKIKETFGKFAEQKAEFLITLDSIGLLMDGDSITALLNAIKDIIVEGNKDIVKDSIRLFTYKTMEPNAFSLGEGLMLISTGLLERMPDVRQLAFVISHELAHETSDHLFYHLQQVSESLHDDQMKRSLQKARRYSAGRRTQLKSIFTALKAIHMEHSQANEFEADSIGLLYYQSAGFSKQGAVDALGILDQSDYLLYKDTLDLRHYFSFSTYPFKSYWLEPENAALNWDMDTTLYIIPDSLKTHPNCDERILRIERQASFQANRIPDVTSEAHSLEIMKEIFQFENLESQILSKDYVMALYLSLHLQAKYPDNIYLKCVTVHALLELAGVVSRNEVLEYVEFADKNYPDGYNQILIFLHNLNSSTLYKLAELFTAENLGHVSDHPYVSFLNILIEEQETISEESINRYAEQFKDDYFIGLMHDRKPEPPAAKQK
jgi:Zn-dependent protease with chaperone function